MALHVIVSSLLFHLQYQKSLFVFQGPKGLQGSPGAEGLQGTQVSVLPIVLFIFCFDLSPLFSEERRHSLRSRFDLRNGENPFHWEGGGGGGVWGYLSNFFSGFQLFSETT